MRALFTLVMGGCTHEQVHRHFIRPRVVSFLRHCPTHFPEETLAAQYANIVKVHNDHSHYRSARSTGGSRRRGIQRHVRNSCLPTAGPGRNTHASNSSASFRLKENTKGKRGPRTSVSVRKLSKTANYVRATMRWMRTIARWSPKRG